MDIVYFETNHRNGLIYILTHIEVRNNKILTQGIGLSLFFWTSNNSVLMFKYTCLLDNNLI